MRRPEARKLLEGKLKDGLDHPEENPTRLHLEAIRKAPDLFQFERAHACARRAHIHNMARQVKEGRTLAAIWVWWGGDGWYCIDGYQRLEAYTIGKWPHNEPVPVRVYRGSIVSALLKAGWENAPDKLPMTTREKMQAAWEVVVTTTTSEASAASIGKAFTISERSVFAMRAVKKALMQKAPESDLSSWPRARAEAEGKAMDDDDVDYDARDDAEAKQVADKLMQLFGHRYQQRPEILALGLEYFDSRLPGFLAEHWRGMVGTSDLDIEEEEADF